MEDLDLAAARLKLREPRLALAIKTAVDEAPPLTPEQLAKLSDLFRAVRPAPKAAS